MALAKKLEQEELDLVDIIEDPIFLGEFLRNSNDISPIVQEWPKRNFEYRWYQSNILSDTNERVVVTAGRAVGKCQPEESKVYTYPYGYISIADMLKRQEAGEVISLYCLDNRGNLSQKAAKVSYNKLEFIHSITTESNFHVKGNGEHPILTKGGYVPMSELKEGDEVAVTSLLPHESNQSSLSWEELRWFGYIMGLEKFTPESIITVKYNQHIEEFERIAQYFFCRFEKVATNKYRLIRRYAPSKHYATKLIELFNINFNRMISYYVGVPYIPPIIKSEKLDNLRVMMEAFFSMYSEVEDGNVKMNFRSHQLARDVQEVLLKFNIESVITVVKKQETSIVAGDIDLRLRSKDDFLRLLKNFNIPGFKISGEISIADKKEYIRYEKITKKDVSEKRRKTYGIYVPIHNNYISENIYVHNSLVLEDKIVYDVVNSDIQFPDTSEHLLTTPNMAQLEPLQIRLFNRFGSSPFLKSFLKGGINKSRGTMDFPIRDSKVHRLIMRIAGKTGETNLIGLHIPRIYVDETQVFPMSGYYQLIPCYNSWESNTQQFFCGVPCGLRDGNVLYYLDRVSKKTKKYRIPAHENPFFSMEDNIDAILRYQGEDSSDYMNLVLGVHGNPVFSIVPREKIRTEPYEFHNQTYNQDHMHNKMPFTSVLERPRLFDRKPMHRIIAAIDTGWTDPTIIQIIGFFEDNKWRVLARYKLVKIPFPEQAKIIDWLDQHYNFNHICLDYGAGGGGLNVAQDLNSERYGKRFKDRIHGVYFNQMIPYGFSDEGQELKVMGKSFAGSEIGRMITDGELIFSEIDREGISQVERVSYQRMQDGLNKYFVMSQTGKGRTGDDHIFASFVVFVLSLLTIQFNKKRRRLFGAKWL